MTEQGKRNGVTSRCACGRAMRAQRAATIGRCATCDGIGGRTYDRAAYRTDARSEDAYALLGARGIALQSDARCDHRGICRHAPTTGAGYAYAYCGRESAFHVTNVRRTVPIPTHRKARVRWGARIGRSLGYCDRCGVTRAEHVPDDGHAYASAVGAIVRGALRTSSHDPAIVRAVLHIGGIGADAPAGAYVRAIAGASGVGI